MARNIIPLFDARRSKWVNADGTLTTESQIFLRELYIRIGGPAGSGTSELDSFMQFDMREADSAELRKDMFGLAQELEFSGGSAVAAELKKLIDALDTPAAETARVAEMRKEIDGLAVMGAFV